MRIFDCKNTGPLWASQPCRGWVGTGDIGNSVRPTWIDRSELILRAATLALLLALLLALSACSTAPVLRRPPSTSDARLAAPRLSVEQASDVTLYAISLVGTPYRYGGNTPASGFDCSGLIAYVYKARAGVNAPRTVASLADWGEQVSLASVQTGDLVVFITRGAATHAGIYVGEGRFVHAPSTGGAVRLDRLASPYWSKQQSVFRRP